MTCWSSSTSRGAERLSAVQFRLTGLGAPGRRRDADVAGIGGERGVLLTNVLCIVSCAYNKLTKRETEFD